MIDLLVEHPWLVYVFAAYVGLVVAALVVFAFAPLEKKPEGLLPDYESIGRWLDGRRKYWGRLP